MTTFTSNVWRQIVDDIADWRRNSKRYDLVIQYLLEGLAADGFDRLDFQEIGRPGDSIIGVIPLLIADWNRQRTIIEELTATVKKLQDNQG